MVNSSSSRTDPTPSTPQTTMGATVIPPSLEVLNTRSEDMVKEWAHWCRSFERYWRLTKSNSEEIKLDIFFTFVGREIEEFLRDLPDFDTLKTVAKLIDRVSARYTKTPNVLCERFNFRKIKILTGESISEFNTRLNTHLDQIILNSPPKLREKFLMEKDLNLNKAIEIASYAAEGSKWANQFAESTEREVNFVKPEFRAPVFPKESSFKQSKSRCFRCGSGRHLANSKDCSALNSKCNKCGKIGHFAKYCMEREVSAVSIEEDTYSEEDGEFLYVLSIDSKKSTRKLINVNVNGVTIEFIIDTGSEATLVPDCIFTKLNAVLSPTPTVLRDYNGNKIKSSGESYVNVSMGKDVFSGRLLVTDNPIALLGSDWIQKLKNVNWNTFLVGEVDADIEDVDTLVSEYPEVLNGNPSHKVKGKEAHLVLKNDAKHECCKLRTVSLPIKPLVEAEIEQTVMIGFGMPTCEAEWAIPLVPVIKHDCSIRLCGDYKTTVSTGDCMVQ